MLTMGRGAYLGNVPEGNQLQPHLRRLVCRARCPPCSVDVTMIIIVMDRRRAARFKQTTPDTERTQVTMRTRSFADMSCSIAGALELVGDRWTLLIVRDLLFGLSRFDDLQKSTGIPPQTLADRLRRLEASKVITKHHAPAAKGYGLTEMGRDLLTVTTALREWGDRWQLHGTVGPPVEVFDAHSGSPVQLAMVASETGRRVHRNQLVRKPGPGADELMRFRLRAGQPE
jgi:DNA-binding HxlR family transcriptional regulator